MWCREFLGRIIASARSLAASLRDVIGERRLVISLPSASLPDVAFMCPLVVEVSSVALFPSFPCFQ